MAEFKVEMSPIGVDICANPSPATECGIEMSPSGVDVCATPSPATECGIEMSPSGVDVCANPSPATECGVQMSPSGVDVCANPSPATECGVEMSPAATFQCGQCFRWNADADGVYHGIAFGEIASVEPRGDGAILHCTAEAYERVWRDYFDVGTDYDAIRRHVSINAHMERAAQFGAGIRILRQEPWEALCSFIISQCNNIPRIKKIVETLCALFGDEIADGQFAFPNAERIASLSVEDLAPLRAGYRARYIVNAARDVTERGMPSNMAELVRLDGVGAKVASCVALFGLHEMDAFPIDTWMKKALARHFDADFDPAVFSPYAGVAQQYMFYYERSGDA